MNIFASLKALLLPATTGLAATASPANAAPGDFAALMSTVDQQPGAVAISPAAEPGVAAVPGDQAAPADDQSALVDVAAILAPPVIMPSIRPLSAQSAEGQDAAPQPVATRIGQDGPTRPAPVAGAMIVAPEIDLPVMARADPAVPAAPSVPQDVASLIAPLVDPAEPYAIRSASIPSVQAIPQRPADQETTAPVPGLAMPTAASVPVGRSDAQPAEPVEIHPIDVPLPGTGQVEAARQPEQADPVLAAPLRHRSASAMAQPPRFDTGQPLATPVVPAPTEGMIAPDAAKAANDDTVSDAPIVPDLQPAMIAPPPVGMPVAPPVAAHSPDPSQDSAIAAAPAAVSIAASAQIVTRSAATPRMPVAPSDDATPSSIRTAPNMPVATRTIASSAPVTDAVFTPVAMPSPVPLPSDAGTAPGIVAAAPDTSIADPAMVIATPGDSARPALPVSPPPTTTAPAMATSGAPIAAPQFPAAMPVVTLPPSQVLQPAISAEAPAVASPLPVIDSAPARVAKPVPSGAVTAPEIIASAPELTITEPAMIIATPGDGARPPLPVSPPPLAAASPVTAMPVVMDIGAEIAAPQNPAAMPAAPVPATLAGTPAASPILPSVNATKPIASDPLPDMLPDSGPVAIEAAKPLRSEALSLLQLVRDQITRRPVAKDRAVATQERVGEPALATARDPATQPMALPMPVQAAAPIAVTPPQAMPDISVTLASQVVDMGVQGQWIDGLARDIAGLSAHGAQGSFQIRSDQLGPVQVDIRQGSDGTTISLTAASDTAVAALRQDSDRLRSDAALSAMRIADIRIERAVTPSDAPRSDAGSQQGNAQSHQAMTSGGQSQSMNQGRPQPRENFASQHKAGAEPAVLNQVDAREIAQGGGRTAGRARYA